MYHNSQKTSISFSYVKIKNNRNFDNPYLIFSSLNISIQNEFRQWFFYLSHHKIQKCKDMTCLHFDIDPSCHFYNNYTLLQVCTRSSEHVQNQMQNLLGFLRPKPHRPHTIWQQRKERIFISLFSWSYVVVTRKLKIIVRSKESLNHSFLFDLNWCQIKRKGRKGKGDDCIDLNHLRINSFHVFIYIHILSFMSHVVVRSLSILLSLLFNLMTTKQMMIMLTMMNLKYMTYI